MPNPAAADTFSLTDSGPVDRLLFHAGLKVIELPGQLLRAFVPALVVWAPLALLAWLRPPDGEGAAVGFFQDLSTQIRFLVFVPLLMLIEPSIGRRSRLVALQFRNADLVYPGGRVRLEADLGSAARAINSWLAEAAIGSLALLFVWLAVRAFEADGVLFWFEVAAGDDVQLSAAGWWYAIGSVLPPFLFLRWVWRYLVWCWLLYRLSRLELRLEATHPDLSAGLAFVTFGHASFAGLAFAVSSLVAGAVATRVLHEGASLMAYQWPLAVFVCLSILVGIAPLAVFRRPMRIAKEAGVLAYGTFASRYTQAFHRRWIAAEQEQGPLESSGDVQGLADVGGSIERVYATRPLPITLQTALTFAIASVAPMLPLLLIVMPVRDLLRLLMQAMI